jgi:hypothetical protein
MVEMERSGDMSWSWGSDVTTCERVGGCVGFEQVFWQKYRGNSKTTNPSKLPVSKKTVRNDVTLKHSENLH